MKRRILNMLAFGLSVITILCFTCYSWILNDEIKKYDAVRLVYSGSNTNRLKITETTMEVKLLVYDVETEEYIEASAETLTFENMVPNETVPFKIRFRNRGDMSQSVSLTVADISVSDNSLLNVMYVGVRGGEGYRNGSYSDLVMPDAFFARMSEAHASDGALEMNIYNQLVIPPTYGDAYVELDGYFWFDRNADFQYSQMSMSIGCIRIIM